MTDVATDELKGFIDVEAQKVISTESRSIESSLTRIINKADELGVIDHKQGFVNKVIELQNASFHEQLGPQGYARKLRSLKEEL